MFLIILFYRIIYNYVKESESSSLILFLKIKFIILKYKIIIKLRNIDSLLRKTKALKHLKTLISTILL